MTDWNVRLRAHELFPTPVWELRVEDVDPLRADLVTEAERFLEAHPQPVGRFEQSTPGFGTISEPWRRVEEGFTALAQHLLDTNFALPTRRAITAATSWVLRLHGGADFATQDASASLFHSHRASVISSVFYLRVPPELEGTAEAGTRFLDPASAVHRDLARPVTTALAASTGTIVFFPSWLEHMTNPPGVDRFSVPRLIVATDYFIG